MKINIKIPVLKARVVLLIGDYDTIKDKIPFGVSCFSDTDYLARCAFKRRDNPKDNLPFTVVIHSRSNALSVIAHEAVHAAHYIQEAMGIVPDFCNDELTAYIVQYICEKAEKTFLLTTDNSEK